jgi:hypothetical protein
MLLDEKYRNVLNKDVSTLRQLNQGMSWVSINIGLIKKTLLFLNLPKDLQIHVVWWKIGT